MWWKYSLWVKQRFNVPELKPFIEKLFNLIMLLQTTIISQIIASIPLKQISNHKHSFAIVLDVIYDDKEIQLFQSAQLHIITFFFFTTGVAIFAVWPTNQSKRRDKQQIHGKTFSAFAQMKTTKPLWSSLKKHMGIWQCPEYPPNCPLYIRLGVNNSAKPFS